MKRRPSVGIAYLGSGGGGMLGEVVVAGGGCKNHQLRKALKTRRSRCREKPIGRHKEKKKNIPVEKSYQERAALKVDQRKLGISVADLRQRIRSDQRPKKNDGGTKKNQPLPRPKEK